jgi:hypothetical protein
MEQFSTRLERWEAHVSGKEQWTDFATEDDLDPTE